MQARLTIKRRKGVAMKITLDSIYNDNYKLFVGNALIYADDRLADIADLSDDLDLITEMTYGSREIFKRYLKEDDTECYIYDLAKIHKSVYATLVENLLKYKLLLQADEVIEDVNPLEQFYEKKIIGERVKTDDIASRVDTTTHGTVNNTKTYGNINNTTTYGQISEQNVVGQAVNTMQAGAREKTDAVTSFSSSTFENTDKSTQAQTTDTQTLGTHTDTLTTSHATPDTEQITRGNDTEQITRANDSVTHGAHKDTITEDESIDERTGYNDAVETLNKRRSYVKRNTLNEIISDVINGITYGVYTF